MPFDMIYSGEEKKSFITDFDFEIYACIYAHQHYDQIFMQKENISNGLDFMALS